MMRKLKMDQITSSTHCKVGPKYLSYSKGWHYIHKTVEHVIYICV